MPWHVRSPDLRPATASDRLEIVHDRRRQIGSGERPADRRREHLADFELLSRKPPQEAAGKTGDKDSGFDAQLGQGIPPLSLQPLI